MGLTLVAIGSCLRLGGRKPLRLTFAGHSMSIVNAERITRPPARHRGR